ncbi:MAG: hypothetical protein ABJL73_12980, partial [Lentilitoribacter sp.]
PPLFNSRSMIKGRLMRILFGLCAFALLTACSSDLSKGACLKITATDYIAVKGSESGRTAPNRAGAQMFNERVNIAGLGDRRKSMFGIKVKSMTPRTRDLSELTLLDFKCERRELKCKNKMASACQSFTCAGKLPADIVVNFIDTPVSKFYKTDYSTYAEWDGKNLRCLKN